MGAQQGTNNADVFYMSSMGVPVPAPPAGGHSYVALGGNDTVYGSQYNDIIQGGTGNDLLYGNDGEDGLIGQQGNDTMYGGNGNDFVHGGSTDAGADHLLGGAGQDTMSGGPGNDVYYHLLNEGVDTIQDGSSEASNPGFGGGSDTIYFNSVTLAQLASYRPPGTNDLWISSFADFADNSMDDGVIIPDFYLGDVNTMIEFVATSDNYQVSLAQLLV
jgi:Ca2+-binding RTX toxin-like protein